jgi:hypothetical protein
MVFSLLDSPEVFSLAVLGVVAQRTKHTFSEAEVGVVIVRVFA